MARNTTTKAPITWSLYFFEPKVLNGYLVSEPAKTKLIC